MPRVDEGYWLAEISAILKQEELEKIVKWALEVGAIIVTSPSIVVVRVDGRRVLVAAGVGSLLSNEEPPINSLRISATEWVDGCIAGEREPRYVVVPGGEEIEGTIVALDHRDPLAALLNGVEGKHGVAVGPQEGAIASIGGRAAVVRSRDGYISYLSSGEGRRRADYIGPLVTSCREETRREDL